MARSAIRRSLSDVPPPPPPPPSRAPKKGSGGSGKGGGGLRRFFRRLLVWILALGVAAALALGVAVFVAAQSLPSYQSMKSQTQGQMIVVRARDGQELVSLGPSFGKWIPIGQIPATMKQAMI